MTALWCVLMVLGGLQQDADFKAACDAYAKGDYRVAVQKYEGLVAQRVENPVVFYDLANAYYRSGQLAPAIANYERALELAPTLAGARENLEKAVRETKRQLARPLPPQWEQSLLFWHYGLGRTITYWLAGGAWLALWLVLVARQFRAYRFTRAVAVVLAVAAIGLGASAWMKAHPSPLAVTSAERVPVHYGTSETETVRFELLPGDRVTVDARSNGWLRVATADGQRGWAREDGFILVGPPYAAPRSAPGSGQ